MRPYYLFFAKLYNMLWGTAYDWTSVPKGGKFVDVGGGIGTVSKIIADAHSHFDIVIQDRPAVVADAVAVSVSPKMSPNAE